MKSSASELGLNRSPLPGACNSHTRSVKSAFSQVRLFLDRLYRELVRESQSQASA